MPTIDDIRQKTNWAATKGLKGIIEDKSGILSRMSAKEGNAILRNSLKRAMLAWHKRFFASRFTTAVHGAPWFYPFGEKSPLVDSGRLKRNALKTPKIKSTATKKQFVSVRAIVAGRHVNREKPIGKDIKTGQRKRAPKTIGSYLKMIPKFEAEFIAMAFGSNLNATLKEARTKSKTQMSGKNKGMVRTRTTLTARGRRRVGI